MCRFFFFRNKYLLVHLVTRIQPSGVQASHSLSISLIFQTINFKDKMQQKKTSHLLKFVKILWLKMDILWNISYHLIQLCIE